MLCRATLLSLFVAAPAFAEAQTQAVAIIAGEQVSEADLERFGEAKLARIKQRN